MKVIAERDLEARMRDGTVPVVDRVLSWCVQNLSAATRARGGGSLNAAAHQLGARSSASVAVTRCWSVPSLFMV